MAADERAPEPTQVLIAQHGMPMVASVEIVVQGAAAVDGEIQINFTSFGSETKAIRVKASALVPADQIAASLAEALRAAIAPSYAVDRHDGTKIKVAAGKDGARFRLTIEEPQPGGLTILLR